MSFKYELGKRVKGCTLKLASHELYRYMKDPRNIIR